jgi:hypothetical protein
MSQENVFYTVLKPVFRIRIGFRVHIQKALISDLMRKNEEIIETRLGTAIENSIPLQGLNVAIPDGRNYS